MSSHKPGSLKQSNKKHKGKSGKRAQNRLFGEGKVASTAGRSVKNSTSNAVNERQNRINRNSQIKKQKAASSWLQKRIGSAQSCPKLIAIITLNSDAKTTECLEQCLSQSTWSANKEDMTQSTMVHAHYTAHKTRCTFIKSAADASDLLSAVELAKVADVVLLVVHARTVSGGGNIIDETGLRTLSALKALGCPEALFCVMGLDGATTKTTQSLRKTVLTQLEQQAVMPDAKVVETHNATQLVRSLCNATPKAVSWRASRSYIVSDSVSVQQQEDGKCGLRVSGYLRGAPMSVHSLMHVLGAGTGRIVRIWPASVAEKRAASGGVKLQSEGAVPVDALSADPSKQDSLVMEAAYDGIMGEQTWPTVAELNGSAGEMDKNAGRNRRAITSQIPVGMSSYQADWFQDEDGRTDFTADPAADRQIGDDDDGDEEDDNRVEQAPIVEDNDGDDDDGNDDNMSVGTAAHHDAASSRANKAQLRAALAQDDKEFPDEVQTPSDVSARSRFARYRALQSFRASPWHPKENLPQDYAKLFQFENFGGTQRRILQDSRAVEQLQQTGDLATDRHVKIAKRAHNRSASGSVCASVSEMQLDDDDEDDDENGGDVMQTSSAAADAANESHSQSFTVSGADDFVRAGQLVHIEIADVPAEAAARLATLGYLSLFNMFQHENKLSVLHFSVTRVPGDESSLIRSKDPLLFQVGFRSFVTRPVFSESNLNCDKHKSERFLLHDRFSMASCYGPITYSPCPLLVFRQNALTGRWDDLVATGALNKVDPDRIMLKKIILTGIPIRVRKKYAVVKHMFYEPTDVRWFKPAELVSKHGLRGHIKEPIGTHGLLKAYFSGPIKQNDTVMLVLYKRVFPKFPDDGLIVR